MKGHEELAEKLGIRKIEVGDTSWVREAHKRLLEQEKSKPSLGKWCNPDNTDKEAIEIILR